MFWAEGPEREDNGCTAVPPKRCCTRSEATLPPALPPRGFLLFQRAVFLFQEAFFLLCCSSRLCAMRRKCSNQGEEGEPDTENPPPVRIILFQLAYIVFPVLSCDDGVVVAGCRATGRISYSVFTGEKTGNSVVQQHLPAPPAHPLAGRGFSGGFFDFRGGGGGKACLPFAQTPESI